MPGRTIVDLMPQTVAALAALPNVIGIKDASDEMERVALHAHLIGLDEQFIQLSGEDSSALAHTGDGRGGLHLGHRQRAAGSLRRNACRV